MTETEVLRKTMTRVHDWLVVLACEDLDSYTLSTIHACTCALSDANPRLARAGVLGREVDAWAQQLVDAVAGDRADLAYAAILRRAAEILEDQRFSEVNGGHVGPMVP